MDDIKFWIGFNLFILVMLFLDLFVFNKKNHEIRFKESLGWVAFWVMLAMLFNALVYFFKGSEKSLEFLTGYVIELSLSVDNLFVFIVIFKFFDVPKRYEHRVLFWGILMALILRGIFIVAGVALFNSFHWMIYLFGGILLITGIKMFFQKDDDNPDLSKNIIVRWCRKLFPVTEHYEGSNFFVRRNGHWISTPLFLVLMVINFTDIIFAVDSIPAVLAISSDSFIVYTSNIFAILGLRSLYFALSGMINLFRFLKTGLSFILVFIGIKMVVSSYYHIPTAVALTVVLGVLTISILLSLVIKEKK